MNLAQHYNQLWNNSLKGFEANEFEYDDWIDLKIDSRRGITLLARPDYKIKSKIQTLLNDLREVSPDQYYYPSSDIHMTLMSIISCYSGFDLKQIITEEYIQIISDCLSETCSMPIRFKGITASKSGIMIQGFPMNDVIEKLRNQLRSRFKNSKLEQSLDKRYSIQTAHLTVMRFRSEVIKSDHMIEILEKYRSFEFGLCKMNTLELVFNDWYQRKDNTTVLKSFPIDTT